MGLSATVLGCDGTFAGPGGACSGYLVRSDTTSVWLDAGPGSFANLQLHVSLGDLDALVVTHEHPDHWLELPVVRNAAKYALGLDGIPLFTTAGTLELARSVIGDLEPEFRPTVLTETSQVTIGDQRWSFARTDHPVETLACRIEAGGRCLAYSSDTGSRWSGATLGPDVDLAFIEASLVDADGGTVQHLTGGEAGILAAEAGVARLVLTHLLPGADAAERVSGARRHFAGPIEVATIHERYEV